jgi:hypothetical protein
MSDLTVILSAIYMLVGMFVLVGLGIMEALTEAWIDTIHGEPERWLSASKGLLYLLAALQVALAWVLWPVIVWHTLQEEARRVDRRRVP